MTFSRPNSPGLLAYAQELSPFFKTKFCKCGKSGTCRLSLNYQDRTIYSDYLDLKERDLRTRATLSESSKGKLNVAGYKVTYPPPHHPQTLCPQRNHG